MVKKVSLIILVALCVVLPVGALINRSVSFEYYIDLYQSVEEFFFSEDEAGENRIVSSVSGVDPNVTIDSELGGTEPQFYFIVRSNMKGSSYKLSVSAKPFKYAGTAPGGVSNIGYTLQILDLTNFYEEKVRVSVDGVDGDGNNIDTVVEEEFKGEPIYIADVGLPVDTVYGIYYMNITDQAAAGPYSASLTITVDAQP